MLNYDPSAAQRLRNERQPKPEVMEEEIPGDSDLAVMSGNDGSEALLPGGDRSVSTIYFCAGSRATATQPLMVHAMHGNQARTVPLHWRGRRGQAVEIKQP